MAGGSLLVISGSRITEREFYGEANRERHQPVDQDTTFHWASITKTLTGIAIMQLRDHALLQLDDPVVTYVPELRRIHDPYGRLTQSRSGSS